jgi:hypothetical protein
MRPATDGNGCAVECRAGYRCPSLDRCVSETPVGPRHPDAASVPRAAARKWADNGENGASGDGAVPICGADRPVIVQRIMESDRDGVPAPRPAPCRKGLRPGSCKTRSCGPGSCGPGARRVSRAGPHGGGHPSRDGRETASSRGKEAGMPRRCTRSCRCRRAHRRRADAIGPALPVHPPRRRAGWFLPVRPPVPGPQPRLN